MIGRPSITLRTRNLSVATNAFKANDSNKSKEAHEIRKIDDEPHKSNSFKKNSIKYLKVAISIGGYALIFSISTLIALISFFDRQQKQQNVDMNNINLENDSNFKIVYITTVIIIGCGIGLSLIEASSRKIEYNFYESEKKREVWEYDNYVEGEQREMVELYSLKGMEENDAIKVVELLSKYKDLFVDIMMTEELNLLPVELLLSPVHTAISTFFSFIVFGMAPLLPFYICTYYYYQIYQININRNLLLSLLIVIVELLLFIIGSFKSKYYTGDWRVEGFISSITGIVSIIVSFFLGEALYSMLS
ncbi:hypothetical protein RB653_003063 [Dictyostelium firmibasis]|uniref:Transmembrane protein n=1 Tax=Dictyostelium firmibasis TaxID=79012 RepID=A0AAN7TZB2_9MYCE